MNILFVTEYFPDEKRPVFAGGVQARVFHIVTVLKQKHQVSTLSLDKGRVEATTGSLLKRFGFVLRIMTNTPSVKPDLVEASNVTTYVPAFVLAKRLGVPAVAWIPDVLGSAWKEHFSAPVAVLGLIAEQLALRLPWTRIIAMSGATKDKLIKAGVAQKKITVVYGGVEFKKISDLTIRKYSHTTIVCIARLLKYKRIRDLIDAVVLLKKKYPEIRCRIIGEGPERDNLKSQIERLKVHNEVKLMGNLPHAEAMKMLKRSHLFCLPSIVEGFGIVTVEAMAAGVPFVNTRITPTEEITGGGKGGLLFDPENPRDLANKISTLLSDESLYRKKQEEGMRLARRFDWDIIAKQTETVYRKAVAEIK